MAVNNASATCVGDPPGAYGKEPIGRLAECFRTGQRANHFCPTITLHDKCSLNSQALASVKPGKHIRGQSFSQLVKTWANHLLPHLRGVPAHLHCCSWLLCLWVRGASILESSPSAPPCFIGSISSLNLSWSRPRRDDRGLGHCCGNRVIRSNQASAQIAAWMREGRKTPSGRSAGEGSSQGSAPVPRPGALWASIAFLFGAFPLGSLATCHSNAVGERISRILPCQLPTVHGDASNTRRMSRRRENKWGQKRLIDDLFFLCVPLRSSLSQMGKHKGGMGPDVKDRAPA